MPNHSGLASKLGQRRQMLNKAMGKTDTKVLGFSKGGKVKKRKLKNSKKPNWVILHTLEQEMQVLRDAALKI